MIFVCDFDFFFGQQGNELSLLVCSSCPKQAMESFWQRESLGLSTECLTRYTVEAKNDGGIESARVQKHNVEKGVDASLAMQCPQGGSLGNLYPNRIHFWSIEFRRHFVAAAKPLTDIRSSKGPFLFPSCGFLQERRQTGGSIERFQFKRKIANDRRQVSGLI